MKSVLSVIAVLMLSTLIFTGCGDEPEQKVSMEVATSSQSSQPTPTLPPTPEPTKSYWERWGKYVLRYCNNGNATFYTTLDSEVKLPAQTRCVLEISEEGTSISGIQPIWVDFSKKERKIGEAIPKFYVKNDTVYCKKKYALLDDIEVENAKKLSISENTTLYDLNTIWKRRIDEEGRGDEIIPEYDSWFHGCPKIKKIVITEPEKKRKKLEEGEAGRSGLYTENDMLFYTVPKTGLYAVLMNKKGYVSVPSGLEEIYGCAFQKCGKITGVYIPASVKKIGGGAFGYNKKLEKIDVSPENTKYKP